MHAHGPPTERLSTFSHAQAHTQPHAHTKKDTDIQYTQKQKNTHIRKQARNQDHFCPKACVYKHTRTQPQPTHADKHNTHAYAHKYQSINTHTCAHTCMCVQTLTGQSIPTHTLVLKEHTETHTHTYTSRNTNTYKNKRTHVHTNTDTRVYQHQHRQSTRTHTVSHVHKHKHTHVHKQKHTHTQMYSN